jgi:hypothetical protein
VSDAVALTWFTGTAREAARERWAFAMSAKRDWRTKLKSDIAKVVGTGREYTVVYFITSQYVRDKARAELEDSLRIEHGVDVRILDLSWLLDSVLTNHLEDVAIEALGLDPSLGAEVVRGPRDARREEQLAEVEARLEQRVREGRVTFRTVEDAIKAATLARSLDRPRLEVDGRFHRATLLAEKIGTVQARFDAAYNWAWTTYWWFEDVARFAELVRDAFTALGDTRNAHQLADLASLWMCLQTAAGQAPLPPELGPEAHRDGLLATLDAAGADEARPSNALSARTTALKIRLLSEPHRADELLRALLAVMKEAQPLIGYPFDSTATIVAEMAPAFGNLASYNELFEFTVSAMAERSGEIAGATMLLDRGAGLLRAEEPLNAIRYLGRGLGRLYKEESRDELFRALYLLGAAYAQIDLLWASRGSMLHAAALATSTFRAEGTLTEEQVAAYERLQWLELQLGRVPQLLEWGELHRMAKHALEDRAIEEGEFRQFDAALGVLFLRTDFSRLPAFAALPSVLERLGLYVAKSALLHALGHQHEIPEEVVPSDGNSQDEFFSDWRDQPVAVELRPADAGDGATTVLTSNVLGCRVSVTHEMREPAISMAESILAAFEALASTFLGADVLAHEPLLSVYVRVTELAQAPWSFRFVEERGRPTFHVACREFSPHTLSRSEQVAVKSPLRELMVAMFSRIVYLHEDGILKTLIGEDQALQRAVDFTSSFLVVGNALGTAPKTTVAQWLQDGDQNYALMRTVPWDKSLPAKAPQRASRAEVDAAQGPPGRAAPVPSRMPLVSRHSEVRTISVIRGTLWDRARWRGVFYYFPPGEQPLMCLMFERPDAAQEILLGLEEDLGGTDDVDDTLRITILRGIDAAHPAWYRVVIGQSAPDAPESGHAPALSLLMSRINQMEPETSENLDRFLAAYKAAGSFGFSAGMVGRHGEPRIAPTVIRKRQLIIRDAWTVGLNDADIMGVRADDNVLVPSEVTEPPIRAVQAWLAARDLPEPEQA